MKSSVTTAATAATPTAAAVTAGVTVTTNNDKTGYALSIAPPTAAEIRAEMDANSTKLDVAVSTRLAPAGTLATVTNLTNAPDVPTEAEIAAAVWAYVTRTITSGGITAPQVWEYATRTLTSGGGGGGGATAEEIWEYVSTLLPDGAEVKLAGIADRLAAQVLTGPVVVVPAPGAGQTTAWVMCYGPDGAIAPGTKIYIELQRTSAAAGAFSTNNTVLLADDDGLASGPIPRGQNHLFIARRGTGGSTVRFYGVDADTLALPVLLGMP
jgi:hypothetical protein